MAVEIFKMGQIARKGMSAVVTSASENGMAVINKDDIAVAIVIPLDDVGQKNYKSLLEEMMGVKINEDITLPGHSIGRLRPMGILNESEMKFLKKMELLKYMETFNNLFKMVDS